MSQLNLDRTVSLITGSTKGIGLATAQQFAEAGSYVILNSRQQDDHAIQAMTKIRQVGLPVLYLAADISQPEEVERLVAQAWDWQGNIDVWINNAGTDILSQGRFQKDFEQKLNSLIEIDLLGTVRCCRAIVPKMRHHGKGHIINIGWDQAETGRVTTHSGQLFSLVKGGIMAYSRALAGAVAPGIRVNCVAPGWIETNWGLEVSSSLHEDIRQTIPLQRWGKPEDVARAILWLASPLSSYITGQTIYVNGGIPT